MKSKLHCLKHFQYLEPEAISNTRSDIKKEGVTSSWQRPVREHRVPNMSYPQCSTKWKQKEKERNILSVEGENSIIIKKSISKSCLSGATCYNMLRHQKRVGHWSSNSFRTELSSWACCPWASWAWRQTADWTWDCHSHLLKKSYQQPLLICNISINLICIIEYVSIVLSVNSAKFYQPYNIL